MTFADFAENFMVCNSERWMNLSIVIPVLNEQWKISSDIASAVKFLTERGLSGQIIIVDDGSVDNTVRLANKAREDLDGPVSIEIIENDTHYGKGHAVRQGVLASKADIVMFVDSGNCIPLCDADKPIKRIRDGLCDIAHASRRLRQSNIVRKQSLYRRFIGAAFHLAVHLIFHFKTAITDSQCGFKIYKGDIARDLYSQARISGFMFDLEIILLAEQNNCRIEEFAIEWTCDRDSRLSPSRNCWRVLAELASIKKRFAVTSRANHQM